MNPIIYRGLRFSKNLGRGCQGGWRVARCPHTFELPPPLSYILHLGNPCPPPAVAQSISPPGDASPWPLKRSELSVCWQIHKYIVHLQKHFGNKLTTLSLYQKSFINNNIVNKIKKHLMIQLQNSNWFTKKIK